MKHRARSALLVLLAVLALTLRAQSEEPSVDLSAPLPLDPAIATHGTLANGLAYWVLPHAMPKGRVSLVLRLDSGSLQEEENQRGLAHFLEHMAFNGSKHFPPGEVVQYFESIGMRFGRDQNAFTAFDQTAYMLNLPDTRPATLEKGLLFLSDVGQGLALTPEEVEKERGVILEEARARGGVRMRMMEKTLPLLLPDARLARRIPIGDPEVVRTAPAERLRAYYRTWYRPDRAILVVAGDIDAAKMKAPIEKAFGDWKGTEPAPGPVDPGIVARKELEAAVVTDPELKDASVGWNSIRRDPPLRTVGDFRARLIERLAIRIVNRRLEERLQKGKAAYLQAGLYPGQRLGGFQLVTLNVTASREADAWKPAVEQVVTELRQALEQGFAPEEVAEASKALLARLGQAADAVAGRPSLGLAMRIAMTLGRGRQAVAPAAERDLAARLLPGIEPAEVDKALQDLVHLDRGLILLTLPETKGADLPTSDALRAAWKTALETPLDPRAKQAAPGKILAKDPEPGKVASRTQNADLGVTTLVLENGVRVHVKPLDSVDTVQVRVRLFGGVPEETATNRGITEAAALAFTPGKAATRTLSPTDVSRYLAAREVRVGGGSNNVSLRLDVRGKAEQLPEGLRLAYLLLTQGKVDTESLAAWRRETLLQLEEVVDSVPMQARIGMRRAATGGDVRFALPTKAQIEAIDRETAEAWLDRILTQAPIEVAIVGRIEPDAAERLARTWFGSLPKRPDRWDATRARRRVKPPEGPIVEDVKVPTVTPLAVVLLGWRGVGRNETDAQLALVHAATILSSRLLRGVREERGLTYSIQSGYRFTDYSGLDGLLVRFTADPAKAADAAEVAKKIVLDFAAQGPTDEELRTVERQFRNQIDTEIQQPGFWISALDRLHANGRTLEDLAYRLARLRRIDREAVVKTLNAIVKDKRFARVIAAPGK